MEFKKYKADTCIPLRKAWELGDLDLSSLVRLDYPGRPMPHNMLKGVNSIGYWDAHSKQNWGLDWHRNEGIEITFLETGSLVFSTENQQNVTLMANGLSIMRPWQIHKLGNPNINIGRLYWIILDVGVSQPHQKWKWPDWIVLSDKDLADLTTMLRQNEQEIWYTNSKIADCFREIGKAVDATDSENHESELTILINNLLLNILRLFRTGNIPLDKSLMESKRSVDIFLSELHAHIEQNWTLQSMAEYCDLGSTRFVHFCKTITNMTPLNYLNHLRLNAAADMLENRSNLSIQNIAFDCGFSSSQYFATQFKKRFGISPKKFRKEHNEFLPMRTKETTK